MVRPGLRYLQRRLHSGATWQIFDTPGPSPCERAAIDDAALDLAAVWHCHPLDTTRRARHCYAATAQTNTMEETPTDASREGVQIRTADGRVATVVSRTGSWYLTRLGGEEKNVQSSFFASDGQDLPRLLASVPEARTGDSAVCTWSEQTEGIIVNWHGKRGDLNLPYNTILPFARRPPADGDQLLVRWANDDGSTREDGYYVCVLRGGQLYGDWEEPVPFNADDDDWLFMNGDGAVTETITFSAIAAERGHPENTWGYAGSTVVKCLVPQPVAEWQGRRVYMVGKVLVKQEDGEWTQVTLREKVCVKQAYV